jgi:hypothetical protein
MRYLDASSEPTRVTLLSMHRQTNIVRSRCAQRPFGRIRCGRGSATGVSRPFSLARGVLFHRGNTRRRLTMEDGETSVPDTISLTIFRWTLMYAAAFCLTVYFVIFH